MKPYDDHGLTFRERAVVRFRKVGCSVQETAKAMNIDESYVRRLLKNADRKVKANAT